MPEIAPCVNSVDGKSRDLQKLISSFETSSDETCSSDEEEIVAFWRRWARRVLFAIFCVALASLIGATVLPWGNLAYNKEFLDHLKLMAELNATIPLVCKFKQYNDWHGPKPGPWGKSDNGKRWRSGDILGLYHHMGIIFSVDLEDGTHAEYLRLDFGSYGLHFDRLYAAVVPDVIPWDDCTYWCGTLSRENGDPSRVLNLFESYLSTWKYNGFRFNCLHFSKYLFDFMQPTETGCQPWKVQKWSDL
eukprot:TRINITY_DN50294_c0_g1_i1.p1 TRINITY_DN50294_c0_g1~~TRINITY_DN50294_c0_g1_i1.p1  ORF type:complete len:256 (-),score=14.02 TRINITY_DN50294_c0_g1_i1:6-746(-)